MHSLSCCLVIILCLQAFLSGCAGLSPAPSIEDTNRLAPCSLFFTRVANTVKKTNGSNTGTVIVPGFPYLRANRFLMALAKTVTSEQHFADWSALMKQQATSGLEKEIQNLPASAVEKLAGDAGLPQNRSALCREASVCSAALSAHDEKRPDFRNVLLSAPHVPSEYSSAMRILGIYPLASLPVAYLTEKAQNKFKGWFDTPMESLPIQGRLIAYQPESFESAREYIQNSFKKMPENSLHMKVLDAGEVRKLAEAFAPLLIQDVSGPRDIPGKVIWKDGQVHIQTNEPTVYYYLSYGIFKQKPIVQINFATWFSAREGPLAPWIETGPLDGLTLRISLDHNGEPFMLDIMNNCGCYHMFIPRKETVMEKKEKPLAMDAFVPQWLPDNFPVLPLRIRVNSGWHQVQRAWASNAPLPSTRTYRLLPYDDLEALPHSDGRYESVFDARGIMKGSHRIEPFLLFSMGVPSVGSMRQRGHHAISLIGCDHFDTPELFEKSFIFK